MGDINNSASIENTGNNLVTKVNDIVADFSFDEFSG